MKYVFSLLALVVCLACATNSLAQMRQLSMDATDANNEVQEFSFYSPSEGYVAFTKWIGYTTDSGRTFTRKNITLANVNYNGYPVNLTFGFGINGIKAFNQDTIIVYGDYGFVPSILYSIDKGNTFTLVYHDRYDVFAFKTGITDMVFPQDHITGFAVEADRILKTTNKGLTWSVVRLDVDRYFDHIEAVDNNNLFAFSTQYATNKLFNTSNSGANWTEVTVPAGQIMYTSFLTAAKGWLTIKNDNQQGLVYYTSNGGSSWTLKNDPTITSFYSDKFHFVNDSTGYALAGLFNVYKTTDSGKIWQPLPRDNNYTYLGYSHNDLHVWNANQLWAGGGHGFIELSTNGGGNPLPKAFYKVDTSGVAMTGTVNLRNFSKPIYQYKWFKNDTLISTAYHASFAHNINQFRDTIKLVVLDGAQTDTMVQYIDYPKVWITSFTPTSAPLGGVVTINGFNFSTAFQVHFGGFQASSFTVVSNTQITAVVNAGSGNVEVFTLIGNASAHGFTFLGNPQVDLPSSINDTILCKSEPVTITIQNSEPGIRYDLIQWMSLNQVGGSVTGNGGTVIFTTTPISESGQFRIRATRIGHSGGSVFSSYFNIVVEKTKARFVADQVNITAGEPVTFAGQNGEAQDFHWTFYQDASITSATGAKVPGITYGSTGQKTLRLISVSANGCPDTVTSNAIFVYTKPVPEQTCYINPMDSTGANGMAMGIVMKSHDDGMYVIGATANATKLRSMVGRAKEFAPGNHSFFAKYNSDAVLKWAHYFKPGAGAFTGGKVDAQGNIYLTGYAVTTEYLYFNNGDSMHLYALPIDTTYMGARSDGFVLKLDRNGKYIWHTILYDHITLWQGYAASASGEHIAIKDDHIMVVGGFYQNLSYASNGVVQHLYDVSSGRRVFDNHAVLKIDTNGNLLWHALIKFHANNWHSLSSIDVDKAGNSYIVGTYEEYLGIYDADSVEQVKLTAQVAYHRAFMVKYDASGAIKWYNNFVSSHQYGDARLDKVVVDDDGNTYVAGSMFNWGEPVSIHITHSDGTVAKDSLASFALYKFDANGKRRWGVGSRYPYYGGSSALYVKGNEIYAAGNISNNGVEIAPFIFSSSDGNNRNIVINAAECFIAKYDTAGLFKRVYTSGYNYLANSVTPTSLYTNSKGQFILGGNAGTYHGGVVNGMFNIAWPHQLQGSDGFFAKMQPGFCMPSLTADAGPDKLGCATDTVSIGKPVSGDYYSWTSSPAGFTSNLSRPAPRPAVNTTYYLKVTNEEGEIAYDTVYVTVRTAPYVNAGSDTTICSSQAASLGTAAIAGNTYQWYLPWPYGAFGSGTAEITVYPNFNQTYYLRATGPNACPAWDTVTVTTVPNAAPMLEIETSSSTICEGTLVVFTAVAHNLGVSPVYQWEVNGINVGTNSETFATNSLDHGDMVSLLLKHGNICVSIPTINSNSIQMAVFAKLDPKTSLTGNASVTEGEFTTITANTTYTRSTNYTFKWQDSTGITGWKDLPAPPVANTYQYKPLKTGDKIRCVITVIDSCLINDVAASAALIFTVNKVTGISPVPSTQYGLRYYPNPVQSTLIIDSLRLQDQWQQLEITNIDGRQSFLRMNVNNRTRVEIAVAALSPGVHVAVLRNRKGEATYLKFVKL